MIAGRRETILVASVAVLLVLFRCFLPVWYEGFDFDSDQAVVGLMAKHLAELRTFPLFFYGQNYMLGVQAWLAAPLFAIAQPSVFWLRLPLVVINCAVAVALVAGLVRSAGLRPAVALVAALPFVMPTPAVASHLLQTLGASVEPFVYLLVLWWLRDRPALFGTVLAVAFLHREFTIFALPALLVVWALEGALFTRAAADRLWRMAIAFGVVWLAVDLVKLQLHGAGPRAGAMQTGPLTLQMQTVIGKLCFAPQELIARFESFFVDCLPDLLGTRRLPLPKHGLNSSLSTGSTALGWVIGLAALLMVVGGLPQGDGSPQIVQSDSRPRVSRLRLSRPRPIGDRYLLYLGLIGVQAVLAYPLSCEILPGYPGLIRYALLALLIPIAAFAWVASRSSSRLLVIAVGVLFVAWAAINAAETIAVMREYRTHPPPAKFRGLADYLVARGIRYARAGYWDSYIVDFLSREQVIVASTGKVRVTEYQLQVEAHDDQAVFIQRVPCSEGVRFDAWCIK